MFDYVGVFIFSFDYVVCCVLQEDNWCVGLIYELQELCGFGCVSWIDWIIIVDQFILKVMDIGLDVNCGWVVVWFEVDEIRFVYDVCYDFVNIVWFVVIDWYDIGDFVWIVEWWCDIFYDLFWVFCVLVEVINYFVCYDDCFFVIFGQVFSQF